MFVQLSILLILIIAGDRDLPLTSTKLIQVGQPAPPRGSFGVRTIPHESVRVKITYQLQFSNFCLKYATFLAVDCHRSISINA